MKGIEKLVLAHRYLYYVEGAAVIKDQEYDHLEKEALKTAPPDSLLRLPGSDLAGDYPPSVIKLAKALREDRYE